MSKFDNLGYKKCANMVLCSLRYLLFNLVKIIVISFFFLIFNVVVIKQTLKYDKVSKHKLGDESPKTNIHTLVLRLVYWEGFG